MFRSGLLKTGPCHYGSAWIFALTRNGSSNSVISPGFLPVTGCRRAESGLCHFTERLATSPRMRCSCSVVTSPRSGIREQRIKREAAFAPALRENRILKYWQHQSRIARLLHGNRFQRAGDDRRGGERSAGTDWGAQKILNRAADGNVN